MKPIHSFFERTARRRQSPASSFSTLLLVLLAAVLFALTGAAPTVAAADVDGAMAINGTSFFWQLVLDTVATQGATASFTAAFTSDFTAALTDAGITGATVTATVEAASVTPASFFANYTVTPSAGTTVDAAAVYTALMASPLTSVNTYVDGLKAGLAAYEDLLPHTPVHGWTAPTLALFYEEVAANKANLTDVVVVVASNTSDVIFYFTGAYSGWTLAVQSFKAPMTAELVAIALSSLHRHNYNYSVDVTEVLHVENEDGKPTRPALKFYATVTQGMGSGATDAWNTSQIVSMLASANYTPVVLYYNYNGATDARAEVLTRTATLAAAADATATVKPTYYIGPNVGSMKWKCNSGCIGMVIMAAVIVFLMLVTFIVVIAIYCCCCKDTEHNGKYRRASSMDIPAYPERRSLSQAPAVVPGGYDYDRSAPVAGGKNNASDASEASSNNPLITDSGRKNVRPDPILKPQKKGDIMVAPAVVSPSSTSEGAANYFGAPSREMTTYSEQSAVEGVPAASAPPPGKNVWEGNY